MESEKHLLVIRLSAMGDVAMTVPALLALTQQHPHLRITVLTRGFFKPMFSELPKVSVFEADIQGKHKGVLGLYKLFKELKELHITFVADLHNVLRSNILKAYFNFVGIPVVQIDKGRLEKKALTSSKHKKLVQLKTTHQRYADVFERLGFKISLDRVKLLTKKQLTGYAQKRIGSNDKVWIGIAPFAAFSGKTYPLDLMEKVVAKLSYTDKYKIILFGGGNKEREQLSEWEIKYNNTLNLACQCSFNEELTIISNLKIMLAMDSGNAHLAAMFGIPTITMWGVTHPYGGFYPFGQVQDNALLADRKTYPLIPTSVYGNKYPEGYERVMETITPEMVLRKIERTIR